MKLMAEEGNNVGWVVAKKNNQPILANMAAMLPSDDETSARRRATEANG